MKTIHPPTFTDYIPLLRPVTIALWAATVFWSLWFIFVSDPQSSPVSLYFFWIAAILLIFAAFLTAAFLKIDSLLRSYKVLLSRNQEQQITEETLRESEERYRIVTESASVSWIRRN